MIEQTKAEIESRYNDLIAEWREMINRLIENYQYAKRIKEQADLYFEKLIENEDSIYKAKNEGADKKRDLRKCQVVKMRI